jgi:hypothetical protein
MWTTETGYSVLPKLRNADNTHRIGRPWFARRWQDRLRDVWDRRKTQHLQCLLALSLAQTSDPAQPCFECRRVHDASFAEGSLADINRYRDKSQF